MDDTYYDFETFELLFKKLTDDDREYIYNNKENIERFIIERWRLIVSSLSPNYYQQYAAQPTPQERNAWFKRYLDYPTKNMLEMPDVL